VDTLVAQHLIKTVSAAKLMSADCLITIGKMRIAGSLAFGGHGTKSPNRTWRAALWELAHERRDVRLNAFDADY
jgi:hypothetical protein